jgi:hypothetical protein|tara:strand:+ start:4255 stop:4416 length:162 start_codon:yes stop_codon:yes gene_type:complete
MSDRTIELKGWEQLNWLINRFNYDVEHALDTMIKHNQDMSFIVDKINEIKGNT